MFNVQESLHRTPYEELQSINDDGSIVGLKMSMDYNPIVNVDFKLGRYFHPAHLKQELDDFRTRYGHGWHTDLDRTYSPPLIETMARRFPTDCDIAIYSSIGHFLSKALIDKPQATWHDVYMMLREQIKSMSYWMADDESEGYIILIQTAPHTIDGSMETLPSKEDSRLYESPVLSWRHPIMIAWDSNNLLEMNTAMNDYGYPVFSYRIGASWYEYSGDGSEQMNYEPYFVQHQWLNLLTMMKPVQLGLLNTDFDKTVGMTNKMQEVFDEIDKYLAKRQKRREEEMEGSQ